MIPAKDLPGLATPWPDRHKFANTRRLLAAWRWAWERGEDSDAARNARQSIVEHTQPVVEAGGEPVYEQEEA